MTGRQRPLAWPVFAFEQAAQPPPHASTQQTPSVQKPLAHSSAATQVAPFGFCPTQVPVDEQKLFGAQSLFETHVVLHVVAPHP